MRSLSIPSAVFSFCCPGGLAIGGSLTLFALRAPGLKDSGVFAPISREGALLLNNLFLSVAAAVVLCGTLFPLMADAFGYSASVGAPFFNLIFAVLIMPFSWRCRSAR
ncbi:MAG: hypothetical protein MZV70_45555 [Desulfobacterales bacterium]|nr:hypothetical protein [Desulfobacterales bacterium]